MHVPEIPDRTAQAILAANQTVATATGPQPIPRLELNEDGRLYLLNFAMDECRGIGPKPGDFERPAEGYTAVADVRTWHPSYYGKFPRYTVAEVLAQIPDELREQVTGVQFVGYPDADVQLPVAPTEANNYLSGWMLMRTRLYTRGIPDREPGMTILSERVDREYADGKKVKVFDLRLPTGVLWTDEPMWSVPPAAAGLLVDYLCREIGVVRQGRIGVGGRKLTEPVAGGVDEGEDPLTAFAREAEEETGLRPATVRRVAHLVVSGGRTDEVKTLAIGTDLVHGTRTEGDEIETIWFPMSDLDQMIDQTGDGGDQTLWGMLLWLQRELARTQPHLLLQP